MKTFLVIAMIFAGSLLSWAETSANSTTVVTTVVRVYWKNTGSVAYCDIALRNGRTLQGVEAGLCNAYPRGSRITLVYDDVKVETQQCNMRGCKTTMKTIYNLVSWF